MPVKFKTTGQECGKAAYLAEKKLNNDWVGFATIAFDGDDWCVKTLKSGRIDRFEKLSEAKDEALKI